MYVISNNPYRVIGVLANASTKDILRQKNKAAKFASVGKTIPSDFDFSFLRSIDRTTSSIEGAFSTIEQRNNKLEQAIYWFVKGNQFDEIAIQALILKDKDRAINTWKKVTDSKVINKNNITSLHNLSTYQLSTDIMSNIQLGIKNKLSVLEHPDFSMLVSQVTDETYVYDKELLIERFIIDVISHLKSTNSSESEICKFFSLCTKDIQTNVAKKLCVEYFSELELLIETTSEKRNYNGSSGYEIGVSFYKKTKSIHSKIVSILGSDDLQTRNVSDSIAKEIRQCDIAYFNAWHEQKDIIDQSLELLGYAREFAVGAKAKQEIEKDLKDMQFRKEQARVSKYYNAVYEQIEPFKNRLTSIDSAVNLVRVCKPKLVNLKAMVGNTENYIQLSSLVATLALGAIINEFNAVQNKKGNLGELKSVFSKAVSAMNTLSFIDMDSNTQLRFNSNRTTIVEVNSQIQKKSEGCYIATMAYGDYEHPQVIKLRRFRDETLSSTVIGRKFIKVYYKYSPKLVEKLNDVDHVNKSVRFVLDQFIKILGK